MSLLLKLKEEQKRTVKKINLIATLLAVFFVMFPILFPIISAKAAPNDGLKSWVRDTTQYESEDNNFKIEQDFGAGVTGGNGTVSTVEASISNIILNLGFTFYQGFRGSGNGDINATATGIIMGDVVTGGTNWFTFSMQDTNLYGQIGATVYFVLRLVFLPFLFLFTLFMLIKTLWTAGGRQGLGEMKGVIYSGIIAVVLVFLMPQIVDWLCVARDTFEVVMLRTLQNFDIGNGAVNQNIVSSIGTIEDSYYAYAMTDGHVGSALVYLGVCLIPLSFMISYIKIAIQQLLLFGLFPIFCGLGITNKSMLTNWFAVFFSNLFIPVLDIALIMLPLCIMQALSSVNRPILSAIMIIVSMNAVIPARNAVLHLIGGGLGVAFAGGQGFSLLAAGASAGAAAARAAFSGVSSAFRSGSKDVPDKVDTNESRANDASLSESAKSLVDNQKNIEDVDGMREGDKISDTNGDRAGGFQDLRDVEGMQDNGREGVMVGNDEGNVVADATFSEVPDVDADADADVDANAMPEAEDADGVNTAEMGEGPEGVESGDATADDVDGIKTADIEHVEGEEVSPEEMASRTADEESASGASIDNSITNNLDQNDEQSIAGLKGYRDEALLSNIKGEVGDSADRIFGKDKLSGYDAGAKGDYTKLTEARAENQIQRDAYRAQNAGIDKNIATAKATMSQNSAAIAANNAQLRELRDAGRNDPEMTRLNNQIKSNDTVIRQNDAEMKRLLAEKSQFDRDVRNGVVGKEFTDADGVKHTMSEKDYRNYLDERYHKLDVANQRMSRENATMREQVSEHDKTSSVEQAKRETKIATLESANAELNKQNAQAKATIDRGTAQKSANIENIKQCDEKENQFARAYKEAGYSDRRYNSAKEMYTSLKHDNRLAQSANYKNYRTKAMNGVLSEREHARFQQEARAKAQRQVAGRVIGGIAGAVGGAAASVPLSLGAGLVTGFGGEDVARKAMTETARYTTGIGAVVGAKVGGGAVSKAQDLKLRRAEEKMARTKNEKKKQGESDKHILAGLAVEGERYPQIKDKSVPRNNGQKRLPPPKKGPGSPNKPTTPTTQPTRPTGGAPKPTNPTPTPKPTAKSGPKSTPKAPEDPKVREIRESYNKGKEKARKTVENSDLN